MFQDNIQHPVPVNGIEGVPEVQFQDGFTRVRVLQVEPYCTSCRGANKTPISLITLFPATVATRQRSEQLIVLV